MLATLNEVCAIARTYGGAVGSFNTTNSESLFAVLDAAEQLNVPVIIAHAQCHDYTAPLDRIAPLMIAAANAAKVPVCVHLDHGEDFDYIARAIGHGFTSVMFDGSALPYEENIRRTAEVVRFAHVRGVNVEAELGAMPAAEDGATVSLRPEDVYTKPELVPGFLERTGADALAIAFGTAHGVYKSVPVLDLGIISKVRDLTDVPLVMHGGSGISAGQYREVIARGIDKINYYTYMSYAGYAAAKRFALLKDAGYYHDLSLCAEKAMFDKAYETLKVFSHLDGDDVPC